MIYCKNCGYRNEKDNKSCFNCGTPILNTISNDSNHHILYKIISLFKSIY